MTLQEACVTDKLVLLLDKISLPIMEPILKNWGNTLRFIVVLGILFFVVNLLIGRFVNNTQFSIDYTNDKALVTLIDKKML
jgi:hypothetical protein